MVESAKSNVERLATLTRGLKTLSDDYDRLLVEIVERLEDIEVLNKSINSLMMNNELIRARKVGEYDARVRQSFKTLILDESCEVLRSHLEDASINLRELTEYYHKQYLQTVSKQEESLNR